MAVGTAIAGYRPVVELYMAEFMLVAMDQVVNEANRFHYMSKGQVKVPLVLKAGYGFTARLGGPAHRARSTGCSWACPASRSSCRPRPPTRRA